MTSNWALKKSDVYSYGGTSTSGPRKNARQQRNIEERTLTLNLVHEPTKIEVQGQMTGSFSRKEMTEKKNDLYNKLFKDLENKVAKYLKIAERKI
jgi:hypothetical protein